MAIPWELIGGVGLFLLGIVLFMDGLRAVAGETLRRGLARFAGNRWRAMLTGLGATALIQSAHATVVVAMGLASAGLLTTLQSVAIILGANLGTTVTAWLVATLGLRFGFGEAAFLLVAVGALARLLGSGRVGRWGQALAGFGLLFAGIHMLAAGLQAYNPQIEGFLEGRAGLGLIVALVAVGAITTILTQSSSVTVSATVAAVFVGAIPVESGAWLVIGQNLGTTSTLFLVGLGAAPPGRRLAAAHGIINGTTAVVMALGFIPIFAGVQSAIQAIGGDDALVIAAFHTAFNVVAAILFLPAAGKLARALDRWMPDQQIRVVASLDSISAKVPSVAAEAARRALAEIVHELCGVLASRLQHGAMRRGTENKLQSAERAMVRLRDFLAVVRSVPEDGEPHRIHVAVMHAVERTEHLMQNCREPYVDLDAPQLHAAADQFRRGLQESQLWLRSDLSASATNAIVFLDAVHLNRATSREALLDEAVLGNVMLHEAFSQVESASWMGHNARNLERILVLLGPRPDQPPEADAAATAPPPIEAGASTDAKPHPKADQMAQNNDNDATNDAPGDAPPRRRGARAPDERYDW